MFLSFLNYISITTNHIFIGVVYIILGWIGGYFGFGLSISIISSKFFSLMEGYIFIFLLYCNSIFSFFGFNINFLIYSVFINFLFSIKATLNQILLSLVCFLFLFNYILFFGHPEVYILILLLYSLFSSKFNPFFILQSLYYLLINIVSIKTGFNLLSLVTALQNYFFLLCYSFIYFIGLNYMFIVDYFLDWLFSIFLSWMLSDLTASSPFWATRKPKFIKSSTSIVVIVDLCSYNTNATFFHGFIKTYIHSDANIQIVRFSIHRKHYVGFIFLHPFLSTKAFLEFFVFLSTGSFRYILNAVPCSSFISYSDCLSTLKLLVHSSTWINRG